MKFTTDCSALWGITLGIVALGFLPLAEAVDRAQCLEGWEWSYNSKGQTPCEVAASLEGPCRGYTDFALGALPPNMHYQPPAYNDTVQKSCECNTVIYSLIEACTICQMNNYSSNLTWATWSQGCDNVYISQYPLSIPSNTSVPHWAYLDYSISTFDPVRAMAAGRDPEGTPTAPSVVSGTNQPTSTGSSSVPTSTSTGGSKSKAGAIAGGVVGGVIGLAGLSGLAFFLLKRRRRRGGGKLENILEPEQIAYTPSTVQVDYEQPKLYNPSDPSTFPTPLSAGDSSYSGSGGHTTSTYQPGRYPGSAEF